MIELITGVPGSGKTCYSMSRMLKAVEQGRPLYVHGIRGLKIPHISVHCDHPLCVYCKEERPQGDVFLAEKWDEWAPVGAYIVLDEVQRVYRVRPNGSTPPNSVQEFEMHRHRGLDFLLMTQHPNLIDVNVRRQVGKHIHLVANWAGRKQFEYPEYSESPGKPSRSSECVKSSYSLNRKHFDLYRSAELHTKPSRKVPGAVYFFAVALCAFLYLLWNGYQRAQTRFADEAVTVESGEGEGMPAPAGAPAPIPFDLPAVSGFMPGWSPRLAGVSVIGGTVRGIVEFTREGFQPVTYSNTQLLAAGVDLQSFGRCRVIMRYQGTETVLSCAPAVVSVESDSEAQGGQQGSVFGFGS